MIRSRCNIATLTVKSFVSSKTIPENTSDLSRRKLAISAFNLLFSSFILSLSLPPPSLVIALFHITNKIIIVCTFFVHISIYLSILYLKATCSLLNAFTVYLFTNYAYF